MRSRSMRSASLCKSFDLWLASIDRHFDPCSNAFVAAATAASMSACNKQDR